MTTTLVLAPCTILNVYVGGSGVTGVSAPGFGFYGAGGFNGGGNTNTSGSGSGGGATDIRTGTDLSTRIVVAGGGGGADGINCNANGGAGGQVGSNGAMCFSCTSPGNGGTQSAGGTAGVTTGTVFEVEDLVFHLEINFSNLRVFVLHKLFLQGMPQMMGPLVLVAILELEILQVAPVVVEAISEAEVKL